MKLPLYFNHNKKYSSGFNLVELLVVLSVMGILFAAGYANYRGFSRRQALQNAKQTIIADLRLAQSIALSGQLPADSNCIGGNDLNGYFFTTIPPNQYEIRASCSGGVVNTTKKSAILPGGITITSAATSILFKVLGSGTNITNGSTVTITLSQSGTGSSTSVVVSSGGQIQ